MNYFRRRNRRTVLDIIKQLPVAKIERGDQEGSPRKGEKKWNQQ